jgi:hypothetical protein
MAQSASSPQRSDESAIRENPTLGGHDPIPELFDPLPNFERVK